MLPTSFFGVESASLVKTFWPGPTQASLGKPICTQPGLEIGKLSLSESLALRISHALGTQDLDWLLKNDLTAPLPAVYDAKPTEDLGEEDAQAGVLMELFSRLFAVVAKMVKNQVRSMLEFYVESQLNGLKKREESNS